MGATYRMKIFNYEVKILLPRDKHQKWAFFVLVVEVCEVLTGRIKIRGCVKL